jgi:hypothetical protein
MPSVVMMNVAFESFMPRVIMLCVIMLSVVMLSVVMLSVVMLNVIVLNVVAPFLASIMLLHRKLQCYSSTRSISCSVNQLQSSISYSVNQLQAL